MLATLFLSASLALPPSCDCLTCACASCACGLAKPTMTYKEVRTVVECGMEIVVYAGVPVPGKAEANAVRVDAIPNEPAGVYRCWRVNGVAKYEPRASVSAKAMPVEVVTKAAPTKTVKGHEHKCNSCGTVWAHADNATNASHSCPSCGRTQMVQHRDVMLAAPAATPTPSAVVPLQSLIQLPGFGGCANGNCPAPSTTRTRRR